MTFFCIDEDGIRVGWMDFNELHADTIKWLEVNTVCDKCRFPFKKGEKCQFCGEDLHLFVNKKLDDELCKVLKREDRLKHSQRMKEQRNKLKRITAGNHTKEDIGYLFDLQEGKCAYCSISLVDNNKRKFQIDHIEALTQGGTEWLDNLWLTCKNCNQRKGNNPVGIIWKKLKEDKGCAFTKKQQGFLRGIKRKVNIYSDNKKEKYLEQYKIASCLNQMDIIIQTRIKNYKHMVGVDDDIRDKFIGVVSVLDRILLSKASKKQKILKNNKQKLACAVFKALTLVALYDEFKCNYSDIKDFKGRFVLEELFEDVDEADGWSVFFDIAYEEYREFKNKKLFDKTINTIKKFYKTNSDKDFDILTNSLITLINFYSEYEFSN